MVTVLVIDNECNDSYSKDPASVLVATGAC